MTRQRKARLITLALLATAGGALWMRRSGWRPAPKADPTPQETVYRMLDAARQGNVARYLEAYGGPMEASLRQAVAESTPAGFARYLRESNAPVKGVALNEPEPLSENEVRVRLEYVFADRNEVQHMVLEKTPSGWKITRVDAARRIKTLIPYGTPVP